jgi:hypothetical protein
MILRLVVLFEVRCFQYKDWLKAQQDEDALKVLLDNFKGYSSGLAGGDVT